MSKITMTKAEALKIQAEHDLLSICAELHNQGINGSSLHRSRNRKRGRQAVNPQPKTTNQKETK